MPLIDIPKDARKGKPPCGECHLQPGETCDICGAHQPAITLCVCGGHHKECEHEWGGWREHSDGRGGEQFCQKCGLGAMAHSLRNDW